MLRVEKKRKLVASKKQTASDPIVGFRRIQYWKLGIFGTHSKDMRFIPL
jgi:hypothetical protein